MNEEVIKKIVKEKIKSIEEIHAGISNSSFLVNKKLVVRIKEERDYFYNAREEKSAMKKIEKLNISEKLIYIDNNGNKVSQYIKDISMFNSQDIELLKVAKILKTLHLANIKSIYYFKPFIRYKYYQKNSNEKDFFPHEELVLKKIHKIYRHYKKVLCHNDIVSNNLLFSKDKTYLIDYEFASMNIPLFDLASFISENNITNANKVAMFLKEYGASSKQIEDLPYMIMFLNLLWFYWAKYHYLISKKEIYIKIANVKKKNIDNDMQSLLIFKK